MASISSASTLGDCVSALRSSLSHLESSVETLGTGVADFPRLIRVLKTVRHYELIPQPTLAAAEASLRDEIGPAIAVLLDRADAHIDRVERRIESLKARAELQQGRLVEEDHVPAGAGKGKGVHAIGRAQGQRLGGEAKLRAKALKQKREALEYSIERLEQEVLLKEKELRRQVEKA